jgi:tetratricopeptide (TPR) repeat protein
MTLFLLLYLAILWPVVGDELDLAKLDGFFAGRDELSNLQKAEALLAMRSQESSTDYETLWRGGRIYHYLAEAQSNRNAKLASFEKGLNLSRRAVARMPNRPEGHFWLAANLGGMSELKGVWSSLRSLSSIREEFEKVLEIAPTCESGNAYLALAEMKLRLPGFWGGDDKKGIELLEKGLKLSPANHEMKLTLARTYAKKGRKAEARALLHQILASVDPAMTPKELADIRRQAQIVSHDLR